jgi:hypothetical protein
MIDLDLKTLVKLMRFRPTLKETSFIFGVSEDTIERRIREWVNCTYSEFKERHSSNIKQKLMNKAFEMALAGNATMMIFCLKNYCGWADKPLESQANSTHEIHLVIDQFDANL